MTQSIKTTLLQKANCQRVPDKHRLLKIRDEKVVDIYTEGKLVWINPLTESFLLVFAGPCFPQFTISVRSSEGIELGFDVAFAYNFDPLMALDMLVAANMARIDSEQGRDKVLTLWIKKMIEDALRHIVGCFQAVNLCNGGSVLEIETRLRRCLKGDMGSQGIMFLGKNAISITQIRAPLEITNAILFSQTVQILKHGSNLTSDQIEHYLWSERMIHSILSQGGQIHLGSPLAKFVDSLGGMITGLTSKSKIEDTMEFSNYSPITYSRHGHRSAENGILFNSTGD